MDELPGVFTPALFVTAIAEVDLTVIPPGPLLVSLAVPILAVAALVLLLRRPLRADGPQLTSLIQGSIRISTYIGLVFASALHGSEGVATFALASAVVVPLVNIISVSSLAAYGNKEQAVRIWRELLGNPLIQGCAAGLALNFAGLPLPSFLAATLHTLSAPALACGTLIAGAALPFAAASIAIAFGATSATLTSIVLICAVPTAPSAYILASQMGGDTRLMASITGVQTVLSVATLPAILAFVSQV